LQILWVAAEGNCVKKGRAGLRERSRVLGFAVAYHTADEDGFDEAGR
jgi:hypothetical protein